MAPRAGSTMFGIDQLLDKASAITLNNPSPPSVMPKRHPLPSSDIANWQPTDCSADEIMPPPKLPSVHKKPLPVPTNVPVDIPFESPHRNSNKTRNISYGPDGKKVLNRYSPSRSPNQTPNFGRAGSPTIQAKGNWAYNKSAHGIEEERKPLEADELSSSSKISEDSPLEGRLGRTPSSLVDLTLPLFDAAAFVSSRKADSSGSSRLLGFAHGEPGSTSTSSNSSGTISANEVIPLSLRKHRPSENIALGKSKDESLSPKSRRMSFPLSKVTPDESPENGADDLQRSISLDGGFCKAFKDVQTEEHYSKPRRSVNSEKMFAFPSAEVSSPLPPATDSGIKRQSKSSSDLRKGKVISPNLSPQGVRRTRSDSTFHEDSANEQSDTGSMLKFHTESGFESAWATTDMQSNSKIKSFSASPNDYKSKKWSVEREHQLMSTTVKDLGEYLEEEANRAISRMPMSKDDLRHILSQISSRVESRIEIDRKSFLAASGKAFKECAKTLHDVLCREISSRNEKAARARCQQLIDHILIQAEMMLQEAISSCRRNRQRINMAAVMKDIREFGLNKFRSSTNGFLTKEASYRLQNDLQQRLAQMAEHFAGF